MSRGHLASSWSIPWSRAVGPALTFDSDTADRRDLTVRANIGLRLLAFGMLLVSVLMTLGLAPMVDPASDRIFAAVAMTLVGIGPILLGSTVVRLRGNRLEVVNAILVSSVNLDDVACLDHRNGFEVVLKSGHRIGFVGSAPSLIGSMTKYRSARHAIDRVQAVVDRPLTVGPVWQPGDYPVTRRPRTTAMFWCAGYMILGTVGAIAIGAALG